MRALYARRGHVVLADVLETEGVQTVEAIRAQGGEATFVKLDVTRAEDWQKAVDSAVSAYGKLDVLINNAGILQMEGLEDISIEVWEQVMAVKSTGVWLGM